LGLAQHAGLLATESRHTEPTVSEQLNQLGQLAGRLRGRVTDVVRGNIGS